MEAGQSSASLHSFAGGGSMFINRYLMAFARNHVGRVALTCVLQFVLTLMGSFVSLGIAIVVRMLQGEERILFFSRRMAGFWRHCNFDCFTLCIDEAKVACRRALRTWNKKRCKNGAIE